MNIYLASALTHVPEKEFPSYTSRLHRLAAALECDGSNNIKYALMNSDPQLSEKPHREQPILCYLWDRAMVEAADLIVAEASYPSTGLGIELQIAEAKGIPLILCFESSESKRSQAKFYENPGNSRHELQVGDGFISLMALGLPNTLAVIPYMDELECIEELQRKISLIDRKF
ncbi:MULTISPECIES: hypothetical protein [Pseudomonas]|uniref:hypothetical protein n=1 Tax=Pseudomonas TaxID=286 RepID=UPI00114D3C7C|nr:MULTISPECIES: hypothetical protein [Pseudomonas]MBH3436170.1 hypothetical protein [Pseudomonas citronellolis]